MISLKYGSDQGAAILDYLLASSVLFFFATAMVTLIDTMATGYYRAAEIAAGNPTTPSGTPILGFAGGFAPCGPHSKLGNPDEDGNLQNPEECL